MTRKIEEYIGLDFEKLKIASIVQQGELNSIIKAKPKEFKELMNAVIGIDKLDLSSENMKTVLKNFRIYCFLSPSAIGFQSVPFCSRNCDDKVPLLSIFLVACNFFPLIEKLIVVYAWF